MTASKFEAACHTDITQPSQSLIKSICCPESCKFSSKATQWGCIHEKMAMEVYLEKKCNATIQTSLFRILDW